MAFTLRPAALDTAGRFGWRPIGRGTSSDQVEVIYRKNPRPA
jgi:hypothetical protein